MDIPCVMCGTVFSAKRASARYCGERCKKRAQRDPGRPASGTGRPAPVPVEAAGRVAPVAALRPATGRIVELTERTLRDAGRLDTVLGAVAVALAAKLDDPGMDTGSSVAAVARQHQASLEKALEGVRQAQTPLERLRDQRGRRVG